MRLRDYSQELCELGVRGALFRAWWELSGRFGARQTALDISGGEYQAGDTTDSWAQPLPFGNAHSVAAVMNARVPTERLRQLRAEAERACAGRILAFGRWVADYGAPVDWHVNPVTGLRWDSSRSLTHEIGRPARVGDVKLTWEIGRFPHAYHLARAAVFFPEQRARYAAALSTQLTAFIQDNQLGRGVHWTSGQEVAIRLFAWLFARDVLLLPTPTTPDSAGLLRQAMVEGAAFIERHFDYARLAVHNNHLVAEATALFAVGALLPELPRSSAWRKRGRQILDEQADRQFYADGGYIQQSHNYHRVALQVMLWACAITRALRDTPTRSWLRAMERSLDLLVAHQSATDGRLPNYGANDGALVSPLSCCDFSDFRPTLQAVSVLTRGERLYAPGPWDEEATWWLGPTALDAPLRPPRRRSASFPTTGYHVLRGLDEASFCTFRCGSLRDRFSQIDMLHVDVWWKGENVLVDAGSYLYNGPREWHHHFTGTACHNTIEVDGLDQMLRLRQFKVVYWTKARLLQFQDHPHWALAEGEHYGFRRHPGRVVHRRSVLYAKDETWVVIDRISGSGQHRSRLHWLGGPYPYRYNTDAGELTLDTAAGPFSVRVLDGEGHVRPGDVAAGQEGPPRGWLSRYYGEKMSVPSLFVTSTDEVPQTFVTILSAGPPDIHVKKEGWSVMTQSATLFFRLTDAGPTDIDVAAG